MPKARPKQANYRAFFSRPHATLNSSLNFTLLGVHWTARPTEGNEAVMYSTTTAARECALARPVEAKRLEDTIDTYVWTDEYDCLRSLYDGAEQTGVVLSAMVSVVTMKTPTAEDEGLPIVFLDIDDVLCLNNPYGGSDALEAVKGRHADPDTVLREIFAAEPKRVLESVHKEMGGQLRYVISSSWRQVFSREQIERVFRTADVGFVAVDLHEKWETPSRLRRTDRIEEIESWLHHYTKGSPSWSLTTIIRAHR